MRQRSQDLRLRFDFNNMMAEYVGKEQGITKAQLKANSELCKKAFETVQENRGKGMMGWSELPYNQDQVVADILETAKAVRKSCKYFVVLGIGGSALGPIAVFQALKHLHYNDLKDKARKGPKFYVEDNVDPERMLALFDVIEPEKTIFNVITKSGSTSETMSQYLIIWDMLKQKFGERAKDHVIATTSMQSGNLIKIAKKEGLKTFYIPDGVGGRFSELCPVGLLPAAVLGIDIKKMLKGAAYIDKLCNKPDYTKNPAMAFAILQYLAFNQGKNVSVMMPYADSLKYMADWYCQLWAESLGKAVKKDGSPAFVGQTPVKSLGVTDQHSQVQLYTEGPFDKVVTFIAVDGYRGSVTIPDGCEEFPNVNFLCGHTLNELIDTERRATEYALTKKQRLNNTIYLPEVNEFTLGEFMFMLELATAYIGEMFGIDTYDQPGVEEGKNATYAMFGRVGYEEKRKELESAPKQSKDYIC
ncbi:MAG: glucose-6-phosphate isomerase [Clostridia bacterium]|nr:glucose-6-phosphate isomerase [Clostridia bacterium]